MAYLRKKRTHLRCASSLEESLSIIAEIRNIQGKKYFSGAFLPQWCGKSHAVICHQLLFLP